MVGSAVSPPAIEASDKGGYTDKVVGYGIAEVGAARIPRITTRPSNPVYPEGSVLLRVSARFCVCVPEERASFG